MAVKPVVRKVRSEIRRMRAGNTLDALTASTLEEAARKSLIRSERSRQEHRQAVALALREITECLYFGQPRGAQEPSRAYASPALLAHEKLTEYHRRRDRGRREQDF